MPQSTRLTGQLLSTPYIGSSRHLTSTRWGEWSLSEVPPYDFRHVLDLEADPRRLQVGHAPQVLHPQPLQLIEVRGDRSSPEAGLPGLLPEALRHPGGYVCQPREFPTLVGEGGHDEAHPLRERKVELQANLDGLSDGVSHTPYILRLGDCRCIQGRLLSSVNTSGRTRPQRSRRRGRLRG